MEPTQCLSEGIIAITFEYEFRMTGSDADGIIGIFMNGIISHLAD